MTPERSLRINNVLEKRQNDITIILENIEDPHNISAVFRSCDAIGIQDVYVLNTKIPKHKKYGNKSSSSANKWITINEFDNIKNCITEIRKNYDKIYCAYLDESATQLFDLNLTQKIALVFGNETFGISNELKNECDGNFIIPQVGMIKSLNISVACAVTLYEAFRQKEIKGHYISRKLDIAKQNLILQKWRGY